MSLKLLPREITLPEKIGKGKEFDYFTNEPCCTLGHLRHLCFKSEFTPIGQDSEWKKLTGRFTKAMQRVVQALTGRRCADREIIEMNDSVLETDSDRALVFAACLGVLGYPIKGWRKAARLAEKAKKVRS